MKKDHFGPFGERVPNYFDPPYYKSLLTDPFRVFQSIRYELNKIRIDKLLHKLLLIQNIRYYYLHSGYFQAVQWVHETINSCVHNEI